MLANLLEGYFFFDQWRVGNLLDDTGGTGIEGQTTTLAAVADRAVVVHGDMADFAGVSVVAAEELSAADRAQTNTVSHAEIQKIAAAPSTAVVKLCQGCAVVVVIEEGGQIVLLGEQVPEVQIFYVVEVHGVEKHAAVGIDRAKGSNADANDIRMVPQQAVSHPKDVFHQLIRRIDLGELERF